MIILFRTVTPVHAWSVDTDALNHRWKIESVVGEIDVYNIQNMQSRTYMDLTASQSTAH
jgi:hypothetical protein